MRRNQYPFLIALIIFAAFAILYFGTREAEVTHNQLRTREISGTQSQKQELESLYNKALKNGEHEIVVYQSAMDYEWQPLWSAFAETFPGINITYMHVAPGEVISRLDTEKVTNAHYADVISFPVNNIYDLRDKGYLQPYNPPTAEGLPDYYQSKDNTIHFAYNKVFGLGFNKNRLGNSKLPQTVKELLSDDWKDKFEIGAPAGGAGTTDIALVKLLESGKINHEDLLKLRDNGGTGGTQEYGIIMMAQSRTILNPWAYLPPLERQKSRGVPIDITYPDEFTLLVPFGQGIVQNSIHPNAARLLVSWLFTPDAQKLLADKAFSYGNMPNAPRPQGMPESISNKITNPRFYPENLAAALKDWIPKFKDIWFKPIKKEGAKNVKKA